MESIANWIHKRGLITPNRNALISEHNQYTYKSLSTKVKSMAGLLQNKYQLEKGDRVAILSHNREEYIISYFAIAQLGLIAVPLNIRLRATEIAFQLTDSGTKMILFETETEALLEEIKDLFVFENAYSFDERIADTEETVVTVEVDASVDPFIICYTSGTTGRPKGAVLTQGNMFWNAVNNQYAIDITSTDIVHVLLPLFHIGGIGLFAFPTLLAGGSIVIPGKFNAELAIRSIETHRVTIVMGVPTIHDAIRKHALFDTADFSSVRWFYSGGAPCSEEIIRSFIDRGLPFGQGMGMTETAPTIFMLSKEDYKRKIGSIGRPVMFCEIALVDEMGQPVDTDEVGELIIKGPNVMKEYWGLPDKTKEAIRDGWFYSGDLMRQDAEGFIYVAGRKKDMIISGGENIYPLQVEQTIYELQAIHECAVIGMADDKWGEVPIAFISLNDGKTISKTEIMAHCRANLATYKVPKDIRIIEELPKNATGKIDKGKLTPLFNFPT
ncbi:AMP-binding protein [Oceanobacillus profundus]|uniref:AMP-binding protein n=1 Tax=Oceanobacillus TaxID=182709 RepID=UPI000BA7CB26|nr:AMP-binding protein [Oceanobacillus profundus]MBR3121182.1 AMP-binding protein [Oceanobacillus sp.]MCM3397829.1 AMP-binding protein [Oceanobacillus profundus]PAE28051.1 acyl-CoA synthetase [Paenibacillus sp. 7884-2]